MILIAETEGELTISNDDRHLIVGIEVLVEAYSSLSHAVGKVVPATDGLICGRSSIDLLYVVLIQASELRRSSVSVELSGDILCTSLVSVETSITVV